MIESPMQYKKNGLNLKIKKLFLLLISNDKNKLDLFKFNRYSNLRFLQTSFRSISNPLILYILLSFNLTQHLFI